MKVSNIKNKFTNWFIIILASIIIMCIGYFLLLDNINAELNYYLNKDNIVIQDTILETILQKNIMFFRCSIALLVITFIYGITLIFKLDKDILVPIDEISKSMDNLYADNLNYKNTFNSNNECEEWCREVINVTTEISSYVEEIDRVIKEFSSGNLDARIEFEFRGDFKKLQLSTVDMIAIMNTKLTQNELLEKRTDDVSVEELLDAIRMAKAGERVRIKNQILIILNDGSYLSEGEISAKIEKLIGLKYSYQQLTPILADMAAFGFIGKKIENHLISYRRC